MAFYTIFEGTHCDSSGQEWSYVIGSRNLVTGAAVSPEMIAPGIQINWDGDNLNYTRALTGSSCEVSFLLDEGQRARMDMMLIYPEGTVGILVFKGTNKTTKGGSPTLEWAGHLLPETVGFLVENELHTMSMTFTCGIATLKHYDFASSRGDRYIEDRANFERILFRAFQKLPSYSLIRAYEYERAGDEGPQGDWLWLRDIGLPVPLKDTANPEPWEYTEGVLHHLYVHSDTFTIRKERKERHREIYEAPGSVNTYDVVEDICKCLGATIMWSGQGWVMFNRTSFYHFADNVEDLKSNVHYISYDQSTSTGFEINASQDVYGDDEIDLSTRGQFSTDVYTAERDNETLAGATEGRTLTLGGAVMTHEDAPADWIIAEGMAREGVPPSPGLSGSAQTAMNNGAFNIPNRPFNQLDQYSHNRNYRQEYIFDFNIYNREDYNSNYDYPNHTLRNEIKFYNPDFLFGFPKRTASQISLQGGQDLQYMLEGSVSFRHWKVPFLDGNQRSAFWIGGRLVLRTVIEVRDTGGTSYRLARIAQTEGSPYANDVDTYFPANEVFPSDTGDYRPLGYSELKWVDSSDGFYGAAFFEIILPHEDNMQEDSEIQTIPGTFTPLESSAYWDNAEQPMYGGFCHEYNEEDDQLVANKDTVQGAHLHYQFMEDIAFPLPGDSSTTFDRVIMSYRLDLRDRDGSVVWRSGTDYPTNQTTPIWPDTTNVQWPHFYFPKKMVLNKACLRVNSGEKGSLVTQATGAGGLEVLNIGSSRIGSRSQSQRTLVTGTISSGVYETSGSFNTGGETPALDGYGFENLRWEPWGNRLEDDNSNVIGPNVPHYTSLHKLVCQEYLHVYGMTRKSFAGQIKSYNEAGSDFYRPYQIFRTSKYETNDAFGNTVFYNIMFVRYSWSMLEGSSYEGILLDIDREPNLDSEDFDNGTGGSTGGNGGKPGGFSGPYGFTFGISGDIDGITGDIDGLTNDVSGIKDVTDFITVTGDVDLDDVVDLTGKLQTLPDTSSTNVLLQLRTDGNLSVLADGTSGQFLKTDGSGNFTFDTVSTSDTVQIASRSPLINLTTGRSYYFGDTSTGWEGSYVRNQTTITSIGAGFSNCGIVCPKALTSLSFMANIRSVNRTDALTVKVAKGARPDGTTSNITLTELGSDTITVSQLYRFYKMDIDVTGISVKKGDLIFLFWYRDGVSVSAANYYTTWTLQGS